ncbi:MAG: DUF2269 family protein [Anaerolineales bacterium]|nr:DUF2269 family protein [Anaerolineales bacterium]MCB9144919.1 DUF2269 family protein [Anaerolineales bacterium]
MLYTIAKWIHILSAIVSLGANLTYFPWFMTVPKSRETLVYTLKTIRLLDNWIANPAYILAYITGEIMMRAGGQIHYSTPWMTVALILYATISVLGLFVYAPMLKKQQQLAETKGADDADYQRVSRNGIILGTVIVIITIGITYLMVAKPQLW